MPFQWPGMLVWNTGRILNWSEFFSSPHHLGLEFLLKFECDLRAIVTIKLHLKLLKKIFLKKTWWPKLWKSKFFKCFRISLVGDSSKLPNWTPSSIDISSSKTNSWEPVLNSPIDFRSSSVWVVLQYWTFKNIFIYLKLKIFIYIFIFWLYGNALCRNQFQMLWPFSKSSSSVRIIITNMIIILKFLQIFYLSIILN